jgi:hypothetical protein
VALGVPNREDLLRGTTSATVLGLDLRLTVVKSSTAGRMKGVVMQNGDSMKNVAGKRT